MSTPAAAAAVIIAAALVAAPRQRPSPSRRGMARWGRAGRLRRSGRSAEAALPDLVDLLVIAASAGLSPAACITHVVPLVPAPFAPALGRVAAGLASGMPFARSLEVLGEAVGPAGRPLVGALADAAERGTPLAPALAAVARDARDVRRRAAQVRARRLPVSLLFPLVLCTLPAAVLVTVVPVVVVSVRSLAL